MSDFEILLLAFVPAVIGFVIGFLTGKDWDSQTEMLLEIETEMLLEIEREEKEG